jgi:hypothetical protein
MEALGSWSGLLAGLREKWALLAPARAPLDAARWQQQLTQMTADQDALVRAGQWRRGALDLLTICGMHRRELAHAGALAWLCNSSIDHGLAAGFLHRVLRLAGHSGEVGPGVEVGTEVVGDTSRADLVARSDEWTLILELKIDAAEQPEQCQRLFDDWRDEPGPRLLFITPTGRRPTTTSTREARAAWRTASWRQILAALDEVMAEATTDGLAREAGGALHQYRQTLHKLFGRGSR